MSLRKLQHVIDNLREPSDLRGLTDQLAYILEVYNATSTHPAYREDIHSIIRRAIDLARTLADDSYSACHAINEATRLIETVTRIIRKLEDRPEAYSYGIFYLDSGVLRKSTYTTKAEAEADADELATTGRKVQVVPVHVICDLGFRPRDPGPSASELEAAALESDEAFLSTTIEGSSNEPASSPAA